MANEKKAFERMKNDFVKVNADLNIMKEDMQEMLEKFQAVIQRVSSLEEENKNLRAHNKDLVKMIQNPRDARNVYYEEQQPRHYRDVEQAKPSSNYHGHTSNHVNVENSTPLSEMSAFNTLHNTSSVEMNNIINNNIEKNKNRRFLIPKNS